MNKNQSKVTNQPRLSKSELKEKEDAWTKRIVKTIGLTFIILLVLGVIGGLGYFKYALGPVNKKNDQAIKVTIPMNSSNKKIANVLEDNQIIHNSEVFTVYLKSKSIANLQAGHYKLYQNMDADQVIETLQKGGVPISAESDNKIVIKEGMQITEIAEEIGNKTDIDAKDFLELTNNKSFIKMLQSKYPDLLSSMNLDEGVKYKLEGYLAPATYDYVEGLTAQDLITDMVSKMNNEFQKVKETYPNTGLSFHQILTLASIVEKEGVTPEDRKLIAGVFLNRLNAGMAMQSDITVLYALGEHKELVTYDDLKVDSPYNLYMYAGLGPGPFNSPSSESIEAVINSTPSDYYFFVADLETQKVYYSATQEEHDALVAKYVNNKKAANESETTVEETSSQE